jgi:hypothetical protein
MELAGCRRRLPGMTLRTVPSRSVAGALLALALVTAACGGSSAPASPPGSPPGSASPSGDPGATTPPSITEPTPVPGSTMDPGADPGAGQGGDSSGGSVPGNPGVGGPLPVDPGAGGGVPVDPQPTIVTPTVGVTGVHAVPAAKLEAAANGRDVAVRIAWWSGVEPCNALAGITVSRDGDTFLLTVNEGSAAAPDTMCIEIAKYKAAVVDLGELEPGTYTIAAFGDAAPVEVTVAG